MLPYYSNELGALYFGDCLDVLKIHEEFDLLLTDPPYEVTQKGNLGTMGGMLATEDSKKGKFFNEYFIDHSEWLNKCYNALKEQTHAYIMSNQVSFRDLCDIAEECDFSYHKALIWNKGNKIAGRFYMNSFEFIIFMRKGRAKKINDCGCADILTIPNKKTKDENGKNIHATEKPVELMEILIRNSTNENDLVLDPFAGSGSTGVACINTNRRFFLIEKDEKYCEITAKRLEEAYNNQFKDLDL